MGCVADSSHSTDTDCGADAMCQMFLTCTGYMRNTTLAPSTPPLCSICSQLLSGHIRIVRIICRVAHLALHPPAQVSYDASLAAAEITGRFPSFF